MITRKLIILLLELIKRTLPTKSVITSIRSGILKGYKWEISKNMSNLYVLGEYELDLQQTFADLIKSKMVVYDIGAHYGFFSIIAAKLASEGIVYAFEAMPQNYSVLQKHISLNQIENVKTFQIAISNQKGYLNFSNNTNSVANTYVKSSPMFGLHDDTIKVKTNKIDNLHIEYEMSPPSFMKIDVEGAEFDVLEGAKATIQSYKPIVHLSTHNNHLKGVEDKCLALLGKWGYNVVHKTTHQNNVQMKEFLLVH